MKKKVFLFSVLSLLILTSLALTIALTEEEKVENAYNCLIEQVHDNCESLSSQERAFALLSLGDCKAEILDDKSSQGCWPSSNCDITTTAQTVLALSESGTNTTDSHEWLLNQKKSFGDVTWYLQIEDHGQAATCSITYDSNSYQVSIGEDRKLSSNAGTCLRLAQGNYWLQVDSSCFTKTFEISCNKGFLTNLLYKRPGSDTVYVSSETHSASADGATTEKINSLCFSRSTSCDYKGSLWATTILDYLGEDVSSYVPYLVTMSEENSNLLPDAFLYHITSYSEFYSSLLAKQKSDQYWREGTDKFYDTALALYVLSGSSQRTNAVNWLLNNQDSSGCWNNNNILDTGFILHAVWPNLYSPPECYSDADCTDGKSCEDERCRVVCGDGFVGAGEQCDGTNLDEETCASLDLVGGTLSCNPVNSSGECNFNTTQCEGPPSVCEDGQITGGEECDGSNLNGETCSSLGFPYGNLFCNPKGTENECMYHDEACSIFPKESCVDAGYSCVPAGNCTGNLLENYGCAKTGDVCCNEDADLPTCQELDGDVCYYYEECTGNFTLDASNLDSGETCCLSGFCVDSQDDDNDCEDAGYFCLSTSQCTSAGGSIVDDYSCQDPFRCCDEDLESCYEQGGDPCNSNERCIGDILPSSDDETCCDGYCEEKDTQLPTSDDCEDNGGECRSECLGTENEDSSYDCTFSGDICCIEESDSESTSYWWIWLLLILIVLVLIGIIFRDKLRPLWIRVKSKFRKKPKGPGMGLPTGSSKIPLRGKPRRVLPPRQPTRATSRKLPPRQPIRRPTPQMKKNSTPIKKPTAKPTTKKPESKNDLDDVLKKLKEMGK